jgi:hypothetical protein
MGGSIHGSGGEAKMRRVADAERAQKLWLWSGRGNRCGARRIGSDDRIGDSAKRGPIIDLKDPLQPPDALKCLVDDRGPPSSRRDLRALNEDSLIADRSRRPKEGTASDPLG